MANGFKDFINATALLEVDLDDYLMKQTLMKFATNAARDAALAAVLREGMHTIQDDTNMMTVYSGAAWSSIGPVHGALKTWTPVLVQGATPTLSIPYATYMQIGRTIIGQCRLVTTSAGTASNLVTVSLPVAAAQSSQDQPIGWGTLYDNSAVANYAGVLVFNSTTTVKMRSISNLSGFLGTTSFTAALSAGSEDIVATWFMYEAAADA